MVFLFLFDKKQALLFVVVILVCNAYNERRLIETFVFEVLLFIDVKIEVIFELCAI